MFAQFLCLIFVKIKLKGMYGAFLLRIWKRGRKARQKPVFIIESYESFPAIAFFILFRNVFFFLLMSLISWLRLVYTPWKKWVRYVSPCLFFHKIDFILKWLHTFLGFLKRFSRYDTLFKSAKDKETAPKRTLQKDALYFKVETNS